MGLPWLTLIGGLLQILGLILAGAGLGQAWADNPKREKLLARIFASVIRFITEKIARRPSVTGMPYLDWHFGSAVRPNKPASRYEPEPLNPNDAVLEKIAQIKREVDAAAHRADLAEQLAKEAQRYPKLTKRFVEKEIARLRAEMEAARKAGAADAVPLAAVGLAVTMIGTVVGLTGTLLGI